MALLETVSAFINSKTVLLKTNSWDIITATDDMKTGIHCLIGASKCDYSTPL